MVKPWQFFFEQDVDVGPLTVHEVDAKADGLNEGVFLGRSHVHLLIEHVKAGGDQVWSLTQFYSVDFSKSRIGVKSAFSTNAQSRFASAAFDGVLRPSRLAQHS